jgi:endoglucanase
MFKRILTILAVAATSPSWAYSVNAGKIYNDAGAPVTIKGVNWFGFETTNYTVHGLWQVNWHDQIALMKKQGFNAVRLPVCPTTLKGITPVSIDYSINPDLVGLNSSQLIDTVVKELSAQGMMILLDHHNPDCKTISELWYTSSYSETQWINDLKSLATRYRELPGFLGIDLKNEPHGSATWGAGNSATDWNKAAERAAAAVLPIAPRALIFVEGINQSTCTNATEGFYWGENISPQLCTPLNIPADRLVLSPHVYGPDVYVQSYFNDASYPANLPSVWDKHWGKPIAEGYAVVLGEFGGKYGQGDPRDVAFQDTLTKYLNSNGITGAFYWSWNPNSGDTGGVVLDDWKTVRTDKVAMLQKLWAGTAGSVTTPTTPTTPTAITVLPTTVSIYTDWGTGYCANITVRNTKTSTITWGTDVTLDGTLYEVWSAVASATSGTVRFTGVDYNKTLAAGASTTFGGCVNRTTTTAPSPKPTRPKPTRPIRA